MIQVLVNTALLGACTVIAPITMYLFVAKPGQTSPLTALLVSTAFFLPFAALLFYASGAMKKFQKIGTSRPQPRHGIPMLDAYLDPFRAFMDATNDSVYLLDRTGRFLFANKAYIERMGLAEADVVGCHYQEFHIPEEWQRTESILNRVLRNNTPSDEEYQSPRDGGFYLQSMTPVEDDKGRLSAVLVTTKDITERRQLEDRMRTWALQDELTGLLNRRGFMLFAEQQQSVAKRLGRRLLLLFLDMDNLKIINDSLGHEQGDAAIRETAQVISETFRKADILARVGGDEFAVLAFESTAGYAEALQARLLGTILSHNAQPGRKYDVAMSVGAVIWDPSSSESIEDVLTMADKLMYEQKLVKKASGKNRPIWQKPSN